MEEARAEVSHKKRLNNELQDSVQEMKSQMGDVRDQKSNCENEISRLETSLQQLQLNLASTHQKHKTEAVKLHEGVKQRDNDLTKVKSHSRQVETELNRKIDSLTKIEAELGMTRDENLTKQDDIDRLEHVIKDMKAEVADAHKDGRQLENQLTEQTTESEHLRHELHEAKVQYKDAAHEVSARTARQSTRT